MAAVKSTRLMLLLPPKMDLWPRFVPLSRAWGATPARLATLAEMIRASAAARESSLVANALVSASPLGITVMRIHPTQVRAVMSQPTRVATCHGLNAIANPKATNPSPAHSPTLVLAVMARG